MRTNKHTSGQWGWAIFSLVVFCLSIGPAFGSVSYIFDDFDMGPTANPDGSLPNDFNGDKKKLESGGASITPSFDSVVIHDDNGYALKLSYDVTAAGAEGRYLEHFTYYYPDPENPVCDMSDFDEFRFWIKGGAPCTTKCYIEFVDKNGSKALVEITGINDTWQEKVVTNLQSYSSVDWTQMKQWAIVLKNNHADVKTGTLYIDDLLFTDADEGYTTDDEFLDLVSKRAFRFFWDTAHPTTGLMRDRLANRHVCSAASVGFGLSTYCIAAERGWKSRSEIANEVKKVLNTLWTKPQGSGTSGISGYKGFFYHMLGISTGTRDGTSELSSIDSSLLLAGVLTCKEYFDGTDQVEEDIRKLADDIYKRVDWTFMLDASNNQFWMGWKPETGFYDHWNYNTSEVRIICLLAIGSPTYPVSSSTFYAWTREQGKYSDYALYQNWYGQIYLYAYDHCWFDYRGLTDNHPKVSVNWWNNVVQGMKAHKQFFIDYAYTYESYGENSWGHTACYAPDGQYESNVRIPPCQDNVYHRGTIPPCGAGMCIAHFPTGSQNPALLALKHYYTYPKFWSLWGFRDAYNLGQPGPSDDAYTHDLLGINAGPMAVAIENYRSSLIWDTFMSNSYVSSAIDAIFDTTGDVYYPRETEIYHNVSGGSSIRVEPHSNASAGTTLHFGSDSNDLSDGVDDEATYNINVDWTSDDVVFKVRYSDDRAGNVIGVYLDGVLKGTFTTDDTGTWNDFAWDSEMIDLGSINAGTHTIKLRVATGGSWGVNLDAFVLAEGLAPTVATGSAGPVNSTSATLNGTVNPNGLSTSYYFEYGTDTSYGSTTTSADVGSGTTDVSVSADITGLSADTAYHFRLVAINSAGTTNGSDSTFTTDSNGGGDCFIVTVAYGCISKDTLFQR
ncbi:MAG: glucoamylase family protein [Desulfobacteraceae bacterium]|jgi:hypothetical protein